MASLIQRQLLRILGVAFPAKLPGEFGRGAGALGAVFEHGDVDDQVFDAVAVADTLESSQPIKTIRTSVRPDVFVAGAGD